MAKKISQLTQATEVKSDDVTVIVQDGETKKLPLNMMVTKQDIENKKVAGLAKLDEIEATYENDTYTPTITVKNKSSVKTGEGDEVDYSANVMDGPAKSAILKGCTLVNLFNDEVGEPTAFKDYNIISVKENTKYIIFIDLTSPDSPTNTIGFLNEDGSAWRGVVNNVTSGISKHIIETKSGVSNKIRFHTNKTGVVGTINRLMIIEYQEGMENWDIPYFEGMQSVKMPVLTTTGKNLLNMNNITLGSYVSGGGEYGNQVSFTNDAKRAYITIPVKPNTKYKYKSNNIYGYLRCMKNLAVEAGHISVDSLTNTITTTEETNYISINLRHTDETVQQLTREMIDSAEIMFVEGEDASSYEPFKSNILTVNEEVELRGIGDVQDTLDCLTGELTERIDEAVLDGSEYWQLGVDSQNQGDTIYFATNKFDNVIGNKLMANNFVSNPTWSVDYECVGIEGSMLKLRVRVKKDKLTELTESGFKQWLSKNPITVQYQLSTESIKTVDLMPSGTHPSTTPYCWKNGHIQLSSSGLLPNLEYSVVTSRAGQINQNATMIVKNDKRIFDLEILLAGGLVNTTYQALTLQNQVETGLSKVSLNSETEPDYLLYHMIMKLIEEKAYKLDDLTEKVSVFYLYEKLSDEQFETIYSALYPFVEDEIVEEPIVEELPEVVEDEVIM